MILNTFSCTSWPFVNPVWKKCLFRPVAYFWITIPLLFLVLSCMCSWYILNNNPLSYIEITNIFSNSKDFVSLLYGRKLFSYNHTSSVFNFFACALGITSKKSLTRPMSRSFFPIFSSGNFTVSGLTLKSWIHFELLFVSGIRLVLFLYMCISNFSWNHFIDGTVFSPLGILGCLVKY